jgi:hypothetical protein
MDRVDGLSQHVTSDLEPARIEPLGDPITAIRADALAGRLAHWGFLANPDLPDRPGPAFLLVAIRPLPTLRHYDPEAIDYWVTKGGRGALRTLTVRSRMPIDEPFSWGLIHLVDRLGVSNDYLTFGGLLDVAQVNEMVIAEFVSPAPLLRHRHAADVLGVDEEFEPLIRSEATRLSSTASEAWRVAETLLELARLDAG